MKSYAIPIHDIVYWLIRIIKYQSSDRDIIYQLSRIICNINYIGCFGIYMILTKMLICFGDLHIFTDGCKLRIYQSGYTLPGITQHVVSNLFMLLIQKIKY